MSFKWIAQAQLCKVGNMGAKLILIKLADIADDYGILNPSYQHIADVCECSRRTAITHIDRLVEDGFLTRTRRKISKTQNDRNQYKLTFWDGSATGKKGSDKSALVKKPHHPKKSGENPALVKILQEGGENFADEVVQNLHPDPVTQIPVTDPVTDDKSEFENSDPVNKSQKVPYEKIHEGYLAQLVETNDEEFSLVDVRVLTKKRKARMRDLWLLVKQREKVKSGEQTPLEAVQKYFQWVFDNRHLHTWVFGNNDRNWVADIEYLCREDTFARATEGRLGDWADAA